MKIVNKITQKIKIAKIEKLIFHKIQNIWNNLRNNLDQQMKKMATALLEGGMGGESAYPQLGKALYIYIYTYIYAHFFFGVVFNSDFNSVLSIFIEQSNL